MSVGNVIKLGKIWYLSHGSMTDIGVQTVRKVTLVTQIMLGLINSLFVYTWKGTSICREGRVTTMLLKGEGLETNVASLQGSLMVRVSESVRSG